MSVHSVCLGYVCPGAAKEKIGVEPQQSGSPVYPLLATLVYTGTRRGEALGLRWKDVDRLARESTPLPDADT